MEFGDTEKGFAEADRVYDDLFFYEGSTHLPIEQHAAVADFGPDGKLTLWTSTQTPHYVHRALAKVLGMPAPRIRVIERATKQSALGVGDRLLARTEEQGRGLVAHPMKKLLAADLARADRQGKEVFYSPTPAGDAAVAKYREVREACLIANLDADRNADIGDSARLLRTMSGLYDQAARAATSL